MFSYGKMTNEELLAYMATCGAMTSVEQVLVERLTSALDEVDALEAEIKLLERRRGDNT